MENINNNNNNNNNNNKAIDKKVKRGRKRIYEENRKQFLAYIDNSMFETLRRISFTTGESMSELTRRALAEKYMNKDIVSIDVGDKTNDFTIS